MRSACSPLGSCRSLLTMEYLSRLLCRMTLNLISPRKFVLADWIIIAALNLPAISEPAFYFTQKNFAGGKNIPWKMFYRHKLLAPDTATID